MKTEQIHIRTTKYIADLLTEITEATGESKTNVIDRLIIQEAERIGRKAKENQQ